MSRGWVTCRYIGGPWDGKVEELAATYCSDTIGVESEAWIRENPDGSADVFKGPRGPAWTSFNLSVYEKVPRPKGSIGVTYRYARTTGVNRCAKVLPDKGRRCKNAAIEGKELCRDHEKIRARSESKVKRP